MHQGDAIYSNVLLQKISWAGGNCPSYEQAARALEVLASIRMDPSQIARITERTGNEFSAFANRCHDPQEPLKEVDGSSHAAVVSVDGGRVQTRAQDQSRGVHQPEWKETKVAHLQIIETQSLPEDPQPHLPKTFSDQGHVHQLVAGLSRNPRTGQEGCLKELPSNEKPSNSKTETRRGGKDKVVIKSCLATLASVEEFAPLVRNEASRLQMEKCPKKVFLADGAPANWTIHEKFFLHYRPVLDFVHLVEHLFAVAKAISKTAKQTWSLYLHMAALAWKGKVHEIIAQLLEHQHRLGKPQKELPKTDPRCILQRTIQYLLDNQNRMDYPTLRKLGLPISSCRVESLIKQINQRVKASDKFWIIPNLNAVLQIRAAELSTTKRWDQFWSMKRAA